MFHLGAKSLKKLEGIDPRLHAVVLTAISMSKVDFTIITGLRTASAQAEAIRSGASQCSIKAGTCKHLEGRAVDVAAWVNNTIDWKNMANYYAIAEAFRDAAAATGTNVRWGGAWCLLAPGTDPKRAMDAYAARARAVGKKPFIDAGHFELA